MIVEQAETQLRVVVPIEEEEGVLKLQYLRLAVIKAETYCTK
jgi:hypothetical protein